MFDPNAVRAEMARRRMTLEDVHRGTGLSVSALAKILGDKGNPTADSLCRIAAALGVDERLFFDGRRHDSANVWTATNPLSGPAA